MLYTGRGGIELFEVLDDTYQPHLLPSPHPSDKAEHNREAVVLALKELVQGRSLERSAGPSGSLSPGRPGPSQEDDHERNDSIVGAIVGVDSRDVRLLEVQHVSVGKTVGLVLGTAAVGATAGLIILLSSYSLGP